MSVVVMEPAELEALVRRAVADVLDTSTPAATAQLMTRQEAAAHLRVTARQVDLLRRHADLPTRWVAASPRFDRAELDAWTKEKHAGVAGQRPKRRTSKKTGRFVAGGCRTVTERRDTNGASNRDTNDSEHLREAAS